MTDSVIQAELVNIVSYLIGIIFAYGVGLGIALFKEYRDPYFFYSWPPAVRTPVGIAVLGFVYLLIQSVLALARGGNYG